MFDRDREPTPPMRRIKYEEGHAIGGYFPDSAPAYFTNKRHARSAALEDVREYLEALGAYDDKGNRYPVGHDDHVSVSKEGDYKWRLTFGHGGSRYVYVDTVDEDLWFDAEGDVYERKEGDDGAVTWEYVSQDW
jgi:hypothetical protein